MRISLFNYKEHVDRVGHIRLGDVAGGQEVLEGLQEVTGGHWLIKVETVVTWL